MPQWHSDATYVAPINYGTFNYYLNKPPPPELTVSDVSHQVIPSQESYTFRRKENEKLNAICQTVHEETTTTECQTTTVEEEDTPLFRKNLRKVMDIEFLAAATRRDRNVSPLMNMIKQKMGQCETVLWPLLLQRAPPLVSQRRYFA